jgi:8-oxo-dGTP pyrophosphatase MutT (NUDIX family)
MRFFGKPQNDTWYNFSMEPKLDPRLHFVTATAIIVRNRKVSDGEPAVPEFLIAKRAAHEKAFPSKWTVPGGKLVRTEYEKLPVTIGGTTTPQWYNIIDWLVKKEVLEEVNLEVENVKYLTDLVFIRPDGYPVVTLSYWCRYKAGEAKPGKDLTDVAWVTAEEAKKYDLIDGIWEELRDVGWLSSKDF